MARGGQHAHRLSREIFAPVPDELDETWRGGFLVGGMAHITDTADLARAYVQAAHVLVSAARDKHEPYELAYPLLFLCRHAIELYLKAIVQPVKHNHELPALVGLFVEYVRQTHGVEVPEWFQGSLFAFAEIDPGSTTFRYADARAGLVRRDEAWVSLDNLADSFQRLVQGFDEVLRAAPSRGSARGGS